MPDRRSRGGALAALACLATTSVLAVAAEARNAGVPGNLLQNPGAEAGPSGHGQTGPIPGWTLAADSLSKYFSVDNYGDVDRLSHSVAAGIRGGANYFWGGSDNGGSRVTQVVDVSSQAVAIDAGTLRVVLAGYLGGYRNQNDFMTLTASPLDTSGSALGSALAVRGPTAAARHNQTVLLPRAGWASVPSGTRSIEVGMTSTRVDSSNDDGYADNLYLLLGARTAQGSAAIVRALPVPLAAAFLATLPARERTATLALLPKALAHRLGARR